MIQRVYVDTNVLIDLLLNREPFVKQAEDIFNLREEYNFELYISVLSIANIAYTLDRLNTKPQNAISKLLKWTKAVDLTGSIINEALVSKFDDFEDGLQYISATSVKADVLITRNKKDFKHSLLPVYTPLEFLDLYKNVL